MGGSSSNLCGNHLSVNDTTQPPLRLFEHGDCNGQYTDLGPGLYPNLNNGPGPVRANSATSYIIPPNLSARMCANVWGATSDQHCRDVNAAKNGVVVANMHNDAVSRNERPGSDDLDSVQVNLLMPWPEYISQCCRGVAGDKQQFCQQFNGPGQPACNPTLTRYCGQSIDNLFGPFCQNWLGQNPSMKTSMETAMCNQSGNLGNQKCKSWCKETGKCDSAIEIYCERNPGDPMCTCITSPIKKYNPACVDAACISTGYATQSMRTMQCPNVVDCSAQLALNAGGRAIAIGTKIEQNCGPDGTTTSSSPDSSSDTLLIILITILVLLLTLGIIGGSIVIVRRRKNRRSPPAQVGGRHYLKGFKRN